MNTPIAVLSLFRYEGFKSKFWAFSMMQFAHAYLKDIDGLRFYRLLGTGAGNGLHWSSDFSTYALLTVWDTEAAADAQDKRCDGISAVITRATIANRELLRFWKYVPGTSGSLDRYDGLIYAKGVGEWPLKQMATFSLWENLQSMQAFAYRNEDQGAELVQRRALRPFQALLTGPYRACNDRHQSRRNPALEHE